MPESIPVPARCPRCGLEIPPDAPSGVCPRCVMALNLAVPTEFTQESGDTAGPLPPLPALEAIAAAFPQLEIEGLIGRGGMGAVFKARQPRLNRFVALKILPETLAGQPAFAERFAREGQLLARLAHPNIVAVHDFGHANGFFYLLMEYVDGVNLRQALRAGRFSPAQALAIVPKICDALQYAHDEGVFHRDIKPENILLDQKGRVKLADFGIAKLAAVPEPTASGVTSASGADTPTTGAALTRSAERLGTPHYMAPEQTERASSVDHRADIYSLGVVFYELLTGELPTAMLVPPSQRTTVDPRVDDVVRRALAKEKEDRYQSAGEFKTQLDEITGPAQPSPPVLPRPPRSSHRKIVLISAAVLLIFAVLAATPVVVYFLLSIQRREQAQQARLAELQRQQASNTLRSRAEASNSITIRPAVRLSETRLQSQVSTAAKPGPLGFLRLIAGGPHQNIAIARSESIVGHPLHQVVVHYAGPAIPEERWVQARLAVWGPVLYPSMHESPQAAWHPDPVDSESIRQLDATLKHSSARFDVPGECQLEFALANEADAIEASRQMNLLLATAVALEPGRRVELFRVQEWTAWLEARAYPVESGFSVRRTTSRSPALTTMSNGMESALITIPPGHELVAGVRVSSTSDPRARPTNDFNSILPGRLDRPGVFWLVWHGLPTPEMIDNQTKPEWTFSFHDASTATELSRVHSGDLEILRRVERSNVHIGWRRNSLPELTNGPPDRVFDGMLFSGQSGPKENWFVNLQLAARRRE